MSNYLQARYLGSVAVAVVLIGGGAYLLGRGSAPPAAATGAGAAAAASAAAARSGAASQSPASAAAPAGATASPSPSGSSTQQAGRCAAANPATGGMNSPDASLGTFIGQEAGKRLAGNAPLTVDAAQVRTLGNQVPAGATVDACADRITFTTTSVSFAVEAVPPNNPDMTFRIAGLVDPAIVVPLGAKVTVEFVNADTDQAHGWVVGRTQPPFGFGVRAPVAFPGAYAAVIGNPTAGGQGARMTYFTADAKGSYAYYCPMPGHAEMGMNGAFIVQ